jgi:hypothetical protein
MDWKEGSEGEETEFYSQPLVRIFLTGRRRANEFVRDRTD